MARPREDARVRCVAGAVRVVVSLCSSEPAPRKGSGHTLESLILGDKKGGWRGSTAGLRRDGKGQGGGAPGHPGAWGSVVGARDGGEHHSIMKCSIFV